MGSSQMRRRARGLGLKSNGLRIKVRGRMGPGSMHEIGVVAWAE